MNTIRYIILALVVIITGFQVYSLYDMNASQKELSSIVERGERHATLSQKLFYSSIATREILKNQDFDQLINDWSLSDQQFQRAITSGQFANIYERVVFERFEETVIPIIRRRSRTEAGVIADSEYQQLMENEQLVLMNLNKISKAAKQTQNEENSSHSIVLYITFAFQLLLIGFYVFVTREQTSLSAAQTETDPEVEEQMNAQNKVIQELKGMIEKNVRTINLKEEELGQTKKSLTETQSKVEEYTKELRKMAKNLSKAQSEVKNFSQMIARDLKGPLKTISQLSSEIQTALLDNEEVDQATKVKIKELLSRVSDMEDIISGILEYASVGQKEVLQQVNTKEMVDELVRFFDPDPETKVVIHDDLPTIRTDNLALKQVFYNLISNAVKYNTGPGSKVEIGCVDAPHQYKFWVADNGPGIPKQDQERIFELFEKSSHADTVKQHKTKSSGVGLALVKKILMDKGLEIWVKSEPGQGAKFTFTWKKNLS